MTEPAPDGRSRDLEAHAEDDLLAAVRAGDTGAYAVLYRRHHHEALRLARSLGSYDPDDVAQEAFLKILKSILRGAGPRRGFAPYLMRVVRNEAIDRARRTHEDAVDDLERVVPDRFTAPDGVDELFDRQLVRTAFENLPETWQRILWLTEVEGETPRALAPQLGRSPNAISQLSRRAREGLRSAWLQAHLDTAGATPACRGIAQDLDAHEHGRLTPARSAAVASHLETCPRCSAARDELRGLAVQLRSVLLPLVLGSPLLLDRLSADVAAVGPSADGALAPQSPLASLDAGGRSGALRGALVSHAGAFATLGAIAVLAVGSGLLLGSAQDGPSALGLATSPASQQEGNADGTDAADGSGGAQGDGTAAGGDGSEEAEDASSSSTAATGTAAGSGSTSPVQVPVAAPSGSDPASSPSPSTGTSDGSGPDSPSTSGSTPVPADQAPTTPTTSPQGSSPDAPEEPTPQTPTSPSDPATDPAKDKKDHPRPTWPGQPMSPTSPGQPSPGQPSSTPSPTPSEEPPTDPASPAGPTVDPSSGSGATQDGSPEESDGTGAGSAPGAGAGGGAGTGIGGSAPVGGGVTTPTLPKPGAGVDPHGPMLPPAGQAPTEPPAEVAEF
jgi:RNA polymerase sigma factor (sigma-70 family)